MILDPFLRFATRPYSLRKRARRTSHPLCRLLVAGAAVAPGACADVLDVQEFRVVGEHNPNRPYEDTEVPRAMNAGRPSEITIWTTGNGCVRGGDTEITIEGRTAVVTPYDIVKVGNFGCYDILNIFEHKVNVAFDEPGICTVVFRYSTYGGRPGERDVDGWDVYEVEVLP